MDMNFISMGQIERLFITNVDAEKHWGKALYF